MSQALGPYAIIPGDTTTISLTPRGIAAIRLSNQSVYMLLLNIAGSAYWLDASASFEAPVSNWAWDGTIRVTPQASSGASGSLYLITYAAGESVTIAPVTAAQLAISGTINTNVVNSPTVALSGTPNVAVTNTPNVAVSNAPSLTGVNSAVATYQALVNGGGYSAPYTGNRYVLWSLAYNNIKVYDSLDRFVASPSALGIADSGQLWTTVGSPTIRPTSSYGLAEFYDFSALQSLDLSALTMTSFDMVIVVGSQQKIQIGSITFTYGGSGNLVINVNGTNYTILSGTSGGATAFRLKCVDIGGGVADVYAGASIVAPPVQPALAAYGTAPNNANVTLQMWMLGGYNAFSTASTPYVWAIPLQINVP